MKSKLNVLKDFLKVVKTLQPFRNPEPLLELLEKFKETKDLSWQECLEIQAFMKDLPNPRETSTIIPVPEKKYNLNLIYTSFEECLVEAFLWQIRNADIGIESSVIEIPDTWVAKYLEEPYTQHFDIGSPLEVKERWGFGPKKRFSSFFPKGYWGLYVDLKVGTGWRGWTSQLGRGNFVSTGAKERYLLDYRLLEKFLGINVPELQKARSEGLKEGIEESFYRTKDLIKTQAKLTDDGWIKINEQSQQLRFLRDILEKKGISSPNLIY